jgi:HipA-like C-terminal domain
MADALAIPHVVVELAEARDTGDPGAMILDLTTSVPDGVIVHGNELLFTLDMSYPKTKKYRTSEHTLSNVLQALSRPEITLPRGFQVLDGIHTASELLVGYLLLDALSGNTDRHHENWALLSFKHEERLELAPTYDHASSMGRELLDLDRARRLTTRDTRATVEAYAKQARSALYRDPQDRRPLGTIAAFAEAAQRQPSAARIWQARLQDLSDEMLKTIVTRVPNRSMSETSQRFAMRFLQYTRREILAMDLTR